MTRSVSLYTVETRGRCCSEHRNATPVRDLNRHTANRTARALDENGLALLHAYAVKHLQGCLSDEGERSAFNMI